MKQTFFAKYSTAVLVVVCFLTPFVLRGARDALLNIKNDVKDWLPSRFRETTEMEWFWRHFAGERFIIATWDGCTGDKDDQAFHLFKSKLAPSIPPSKANDQFPPPPAKDPGSTWLERPFAFIGDSLGLYTLENDYYDWGHKQEKWLRGFGGRWYYITPQGDLYEFLGSDAPMAIAFRGLQHALGMNSLEGKLLISFGKLDGPWYYSDVNRLQAQWFRSVVTGPDVLSELTDAETGVLRNYPEEAARRLKGALFGPDGKQTAMVVTLSEAGRKDFHQVLSRGVLGKEVGALYQIAAECGLTAEELHLGGPPVDNVAIDEEGTITLLRLVSMCVVLGLGLSWLCFRSILATMAVFLTGGVSAALAMSVVGWTGTSADAVMMSMPALVYVLGISGAVHMINYYREAVDEHGIVGAPERALSHAWKPALLCNITTSVGLLSLYTSEIIPIRKFGLFSAIGVMGTIILLFTYLPAALQNWPLNLPKLKKREDGAENQLDAFLSGYWERFGQVIIRNHWAVSISCILLIATTGIGVRYINTSVNLLELFDANAKILHDYAWIENNLGMLVPMEIVVKFTPETMRQPESERAPDDPPVPEDRYRLSFLERIEAVNAVQREIDFHFGDAGSQVVGRTMSAVTFTPPLPTSSDSFSRRSGFNNVLEERREEFLKSDYLCIDDGDRSELWRISLRVAAFKGVDYGSFVRDLRGIVEPVLAAENARQSILRSVFEYRQQHPQEAEGRGNYYNVALVLADDVVASLKERAARAAAHANRKAETPADAGQTPADAGQAPAKDDKALVAAAAAPAADNQVAELPGEEDIHHGAIFARTLVDSLRASNSRVTVIAASSITEEIADKLQPFEQFVSVGQMPSSIQGVLQRYADRTTDAEHFLQAAMEASAADERNHLPISGVFTGVVPIVYKAQRTLLDSLISSTMWSFLTITPLMILVARNVGAGLVAMLPNSLPILVIFGLMGWSGIRVDIGSMMTASIALGVAVDDTIHYLTWFREELDRLGDRKLAILAAYKRCATPTFQAATISGLGLSIFAFSTFTPTQRFGYLMLTILFAGVVAELVFYPALLAGPLGSVFKPRKGKQPPAAPDNDLPATVPLDAARKSGSKRIAFWLVSTIGTMFR